MNDEWNRIHEMDCVSGLSQIPKASVDLAFADYGQETWPETCRFELSAQYAAQIEKRLERVIVGDPLEGAAERALDRERPTIGRFN